MKYWKYWLIPALACTGAAQTHAQALLGPNFTIPGFLSVHAGAQVGQTNHSYNDQNSPINVYAPVQLAIIPNGKPGHPTAGGDTSTSYQNGKYNFLAAGQFAVGVPSIGPGTHPITP